MKNYKKEMQKAKDRLLHKSNEIKKRNVVPPVDEDEPIGRLAGGPHCLDIDDAKKGLDDE